jgi:tRNA U34 5-carboxymethylaminomethyl modifying GTPase MnmE/TrmE
MDNKTIYALSTVYGKSGVAVIRISGNEVKNIISQITDLDIKKSSHDTLILLISKTMLHVKQ